MIFVYALNGSEKRILTDLCRYSLISIAESLKECKQSDESSNRLVKIV